jgi:hypothetical protein
MATNRVAISNHNLEETSEEGDSSSKPDDSEYPTGITLALHFLSLCLGVFRVTLDGTTIATAIPTITLQFNSLSGDAW